MSTELYLRHCIVAKQELYETGLDNAAIVRLLVSKGFKATDGLIRPRLCGKIIRSIDVATGDYYFKQDLSHDIRTPNA